MVFIAHSKKDRQEVVRIYNFLRRKGFAMWFDEESLIGGQNWEHEIRKSLDASKAVIVCLSKNWVGSRGFVHKELRIALGILDELPEETVYLIPVRLEPCDVPESLSRLHWVDFFKTDGRRRLLVAIRCVYKTTGVEAPTGSKIIGGQHLVPNRPILHSPVGGMFAAANLVSNVNSDDPRVRVPAQMSGADSIAKKMKSDSSVRGQLKSGAGKFERPKQGIFISHIKENADVVDRLSHALETEGLRVWRDRGAIGAGDERADVTAEAIRQASFFLACFSKEYWDCKETYMNWELALAIAKLREVPRDHSWLIPVLLSDVSVPDIAISGMETLRDLQPLELWKSWNLGIHKLVFTLSPASDFGLLLSAFRDHEVVNARDMARIHQAITYLERGLYLRRTGFSAPFQDGNVLFADQLNELLKPVEAIQTRLGLNLGWRHFPLKSEEPFSAVMLNELNAAINQALRAFKRLRLDRS